MPKRHRLDLVHRAICSGNNGQIEWKPSCLERMLKDAELKGFTDFRVRTLLRNFVFQSNGQCEFQRETDAEWLDEHPDNPWWYCAVIPVPEFSRGLFVKMKLLWEDGDSEDDAFVQIVSVHEEKEGKVL